VDSRSRIRLKACTLEGMDTTPFRPTIRSQADLEKAWRHLMGPLGFSSHSVWVMFIGPTHQPVPHLTQIEEWERVPGEDEQRSFAEFLSALRDKISEPGSRVALLLSRPGRGGASPRDRAWATWLHGACRIVDAPCETVHLATDDVLVPIPLDDLDVAVPV